MLLCIRQLQITGQFLLMMGCMSLHKNTIIQAETVSLWKTNLTHYGSNKGNISGGRVLLGHRALFQAGTRTVHIKYDPDVVGLELLLDLFFKAIDPLSLNKQGEDEGTQYRTGIYYTDPSDLPVIDKVFSSVERAVGQPLAVEKLPLQNFFTAEEYHQDYLDKNPTGYCHLPVALFEFARKANK